ncbi:Non-specific lipid-transfer protein 1 [Hibiscus syriacus]|uniref:Non-specific lipid-transfer protein n=1 Tax=Hibiscus syriacus TaxID=106335 RepID=A0A6A3B7Y6_HIBSY|nr:non-specific lipid-transfer protein 1-like [Hibiscus syriacus]KAE8712451.1 Non-specific lipid-transfer protein 1 [Hibiscus syriacus]
MAGLKLVCALLLCVLVASPIATTALTCGDVSTKMAACVRYLQNGGAVPVPCCNGVRGLNGMARTTPDRQAACRCLQNAARSIPNIKPPLAESLPGKCGVSIPYKISTSTNCNSVK